MPRNNSQRSGRVKLECPRCHQEQLARIARQGFLRKHVYRVFGLYPWQCAICGKQYLIRKRSAGYWQPTGVPGSEPAPPEDTLRAR